jgi:hypothetical protein
MGASAAFMAIFGMGIYTHIFYLPFYFQAVKNTGAEGSGIRTIPYLVSLTLAAIVIGGSITTFGWYVPFMWAGTIIFCVGSGMLYTLQPDSGPGEWIGYQILAGAGAGTTIQIPFISVQVALDKKDYPVANALTIFFNSLGGALAISIAQNIFSNKLLQQLTARVPPQVTQAVINAGAAHVWEVTPPQYLDTVLAGYDYAVTSAFILAIASSGIAFFVSLFMEWKSVKGHKIQMGGA